MQSSRRMLLACLMVPTLVSLVAGELDNEAQAQATNGSTTNPPHAQPAGQTRKPAAPPTATQTKPAASATSKSDALEQALRQKMNEMNGKAPATPTPPPVAPAAQSAPPPAPKPTVATPAAPAPSPAPSPAPAAAAAAAATSNGQDRTSQVPDVVLPAGASTSDIDKARAALHQKMSDLNGQDAATTSGAGAVAAAATPAVTTPPPERVVVVTGNPSGTTVTDPSRDATINAAVQEARTANKANPRPNPPAASPEKPSTQFTPLNGPPLPISLSKEERLQALLRQYQSDQISPEQYHEQRAKILAEP